MGALGGEQSVGSMAGENLDISSGQDLRSLQGGDRPRRRFLGIRFACCDVYARVYVNRTQTAYEGCCPKCSRPVRIGIDPNGTDSRFFTAY